MANASQGTHSETGPGPESDVSEPASAPKQQGSLEPTSKGSQAPVELPPTPRTTGRRGRSSAVRVAVVTGCFALAAAIATGIFELAKKDPRAASTDNSVVVNNRVSLPEGVQQNANPAPGPKLTLMQFTLDEHDSLFQNCLDGVLGCSGNRWKGAGITHWEPKPEWRMVQNLKNGADMWGDTEVKVGDPRYVGFEQKFRADPQGYLNRMLPVFDIVVTNSGSEPAVLTGIEVLVSRNAPYAQGDGEETSIPSHLLPVVHRYALTIPDRYLRSDYDGPFHFSTAATPPLIVPKGDPVRFQVSFNSSIGMLWIYEMQVRLHFGPKRILTTEKFRLTL